MSTRKTLGLIAVSFFVPFEDHLGSRLLKDLAVAKGRTASASKDRPTVEKEGIPAVLGRRRLQRRVIGQGKLHIEGRISRYFMHGNHSAIAFVSPIACNPARGMSAGPQAV